MAGKKSNYQIHKPDKKNKKDKTLKKIALKLEKRSKLTQKIPLYKKLYNSLNEDLIPVLVYHGVSNLEAEQLTRLILSSVVFQLSDDEYVIAYPELSGMKKKSKARTKKVKKK